MIRQYKFLMYSPRLDDDAAKIASEILRNKLYSVHTVSTPQALRQALSETVVQCLVLNLDVFSGMRASDILGTQQASKCPIIVFSDRVAPEAYQNKEKKIVVIEKPFEPKDIWGICEKLIQGQTVNQRIFRRYITNQMAFIEKALTGEQCRGQLINLSRGGANVEMVSGKVSPGDVLKMTVRGNIYSKTSHNIDAEVIWSRPSTNKMEPATAGVRFMQARDFYRNLLQRL